MRTQIALALAAASAAASTYNSLDNAQTMVMPTTQAGCSTYVDFLFVDGFVCTLAGVCNWMGPEASTLS